MQRAGFQPWDPVARILPALLLAVFTGALPGWSIARERVTVSVGAGTDYRFRGISQTDNKPALQASIEANHASGWYAYTWVSNVDFGGFGGVPDDARYEMDLGVGYTTQSRGKWQLDARVVRYLFPGSGKQVDYDYTELLATLSFDDKFSATAGYTGDIDGSGRQGLYYQLAMSTPLPLENVQSSLALGYVDLNDAYDGSYTFLCAALDRSVGNATLGLSFNQPFGDAAAIYGNSSASSRFLFSVLWEW